VTFNDYIQPICLPEPDEPLPLFSECYTIGWGKTKWDGMKLNIFCKIFSHVLLIEIIHKE
jgi:hypothetical protein